MYHFAVLALLALAVLKVVDFLADLVPALERFRSVLALVVAVASVLALDYSVFGGWDIGIRDAVLGTWITGFIVWGFTVPWRAVFGYLTHDRATSDESLGVHTGILGRAA